MSIRQSATGEQIAQLLEFLSSHKDLARGSLRGPDARIRAKSLWEEITTILNSLGGAIKTAAQWQKVWADRKHLAKKNNAKRNRDHTGTGGGPAAGPNMTPMEERVMLIMGDNFGGPQTFARVPAFLGDENQPPDSPMVVEDLEEVEEEVMNMADHDYFDVPHCSSQPPQPLARTPLAPVNTSATQPSDQLVRTPLAPANNSTRRRLRNTRGRAMQPQPNVARRILDTEGEKLAVLVDIKNALFGILNQLEKISNTMPKL